MWLVCGGGFLYCIIWERDEVAQLACNVLKGWAVLLKVVSC
jgi:hypothetical protein